jgi:hypothetical protein
MTTTETSAPREQVIPFQTDGCVVLRRADGSQVGESFATYNDAWKGAWALGLEPVAALAGMFTVSSFLPAHRVARLFALVSKVHKSIAKVGAGEVYAKASEPRLHKSEYGAPSVFVVDFVCSVTIPKLSGGWAVVGVIDHRLSRAAKGAENLVVTKVEGSFDVGTARTAAATCDHCHTKRDRTATIILRDESGTLARVGKSCLADFTGHDPSTAIYLLGVVDSLNELGDEEDNFPSAKISQDMPLPLVKAAALAAAAIREAGCYVKGDDAHEDQPSTAMSVRSAFVPGCRMGRKDVLPPAVTTADTEAAVAAIVWAAELDGSRTFDGNLRAIARAGVVLLRQLGLAAYLPAAHARFLARQREAAAAPVADARPSQYVGTPGDRLRGIRLSVEMVRTGASSMGGTWTLVKGRTEAGDVVTMFADLCLPADPERAAWDRTARGRTVAEGDVVFIDGTVKERKEYRGQRETVLTRVKMVPDPATVPAKVKKPRKGKALEG